jgi:hypothetical protein
MQINPAQLVRAGRFALLGLPGLISLIIQPWTGVALCPGRRHRHRLHPASVGDLAAPKE